MALELNIASCSLASGIILILLILITNKRKKINHLPPGPPGWPIIGNLLLLRDQPVQSLFQLAQKYGPLMTLKLGNITTLVVSSPYMAKEVMKKNDQIFSSRPIPKSVRTFAYQGTSLLWSPYGPHWRLLRKTCNSEIFNGKRLDALEHLRRDEVFRAIDSIYEDFKDGKSVDVGEKVFLMTLSLMGKMVCGKDVFHSGSQKALELKDMMIEVVKLIGTPNLCDYFPLLERFDVQGLNRKLKSLGKQFDGMLDRLIEERQKQSKGHEEKDFLQVMLDLGSQGIEFSTENIKAMLMDIFFAATDTTSATIEWAMTELLKNPMLMKKVQAELDDVLGIDRRLEESDIPNLPYLRAIVKEIFRLHPAAPLIFRKADKTCEIGGFVVPENTEVLVNVWGIGRDPTIWKNPLHFDPDRFMQCDVDYRGQDFELLPFGAGRRICIGLPLAHRMVHLVVGSLLQAFNWCVPADSVGIDMSEKFNGITSKKAVPLMAVPTPRRAVKFYS